MNTPIQNTNRINQITSNVKHISHTGSWITTEDISGDVERVITRIVKPYINPSNPLMHEDELRAECKAKLAEILDAGHLSRCPTRAKAFAYIKTAFSNLVRSHAQKHVFTAKRSGLPASPKGRRVSATSTSDKPRRVQVVSIHDDEKVVQVGVRDPGFGQMEFLDEIRFLLSSDERSVLEFLATQEPQEQQPQLIVGMRRLATLAESIRKKCKAIAAWAV
jgi:hypothetical protein